MAISDPASGVGGDIASGVVAPPTTANLRSRPKRIVLTSNTEASTTATTSITTATTKPPRRSRDPPSPKPILDRRLLSLALDDAGIVLKTGQIDDFYQLLHRQHYPSLAEFVETYHRNRIAESSSSLSLAVKKKKNAATSTAAAETGGVNGRNVEERDEEDPSSVGGGGGRGGGGSSGNVNVNVRSLPLKNAASSKPGKRNIRNLPMSFLNYLSDPTRCDFATVTSRVTHAATSSDGTTTKMAVTLHDGHVVESVLMRHSSPAGRRATLCVSSQVGCAMGCTFCATGTMGIRGNLSSGEILEQLVHAGRLLASELTDDVDEDLDRNNHNCRGNDNNKSNTKNKNSGKHDLVRNVVFMGMGEPLNNYANVIEACRALIDCRRWNLAHGRVTVSTVGVVPKMRALTRDLPEVSLALSLHAPNQEMREAIVPAARMYPIESLIDALDEHMMVGITKMKKEQMMTSTGGNGGGDGVGAGAGAGAGAGGFSVEQRKSASKQKRAMIEYVMLEGDTSSFECAHQLGKLCEGRHLLVNLIPYNRTDVRDQLRCPSEGHMREFQRIVMSYGALCVVRRTMGADIAGACGQLVVEEEKKAERESAMGGGGNGGVGQALVPDIEEGPFRGPASAADAHKSNRAEGVAKRPRASRRERVDGGAGAAATAIDGENRLRLSGVENVIEVDGSGVEGWIRPLAIATALAASCFLVTGALFVAQRRRR